MIKCPYLNKMQVDSLLVHDTKLSEEYGMHESFVGSWLDRQHERNMDKRLKIINWLRQRKNLILLEHENH